MKNNVGFSLRSVTFEKSKENISSKNSAHWTTPFRKRRNLLCTKILVAVFSGEHEIYSSLYTWRI
jgi:hypothetical protein